MMSWGNWRVGVSLGAGASKAEAHRDVLNTPAYIDLCGLFAITSFRDLGDCHGF